MILGNKVKYFFIFSLIFFHVFNLKLNIPPYNLIFIAAILGLLLLVFKNNKIDCKVVVVSFFIFLQLFFLLLSFLINQNLDFYFFKEIILYEIVSLLSASFIVKYYFNNRENRFSDLSYFIFFAVAFQLLISFLGYVNEGVFNILFSFFNLGDEDIVNQLSAQRMVGVGASFFGSGVINCLVLVLIASFIVTEKQASHKNKLLVLYFVISILGMLSARTTGVGILISLFLIFSKFNNIKLKFFLILTLIVFLILIKNTQVFSDSKIGLLLNFSIGFITDFEGSNASNSTSELMDMYSKVPNNFKTWLIGDALYRDGYGYYKGTDVGYSRFTFATGILGLLSYCGLVFYLIFNIRSERINFLTKVSILFLFLILMGKGVAIFFPILFLLYLLSPEPSVDNKDKVL